MHITLGARDLSSLFSRTRIRIPTFQRNYSWTKLQVGQFLSDVFTSAESGQSHFWGPVVVLRRPDSPGIVDVIDGQQRVTTAFILLALLRDVAATLEEPMVAQGAPWAIYPAIRNFMFLPPQFNVPSFQASYMIADVLTSRVIADREQPQAGGHPAIPRPQLTRNGAGLTPAQRRQTKELRTAYFQMKEALDEMLSKQITPQDKTIFVKDVFEALTSRFEIYTLELSSDDDAFILFESLNDRGLKLNPADILKTWTLQRVWEQHGPGGLATGLERWDNAADLLGEYDFTKFLRHFLLTRTDESVQTRRIVRLFKDHVAQLQQGDPQHVLQEIEGACLEYSKLLGSVPYDDDATLRQCFVRMNRYSETHRVFLLALLRAGGALEEATRRKLVRAVEFLSYRWIATGLNAQVLESLYQRLARTFVVKPTEDTAVEVLKQLLAEAPSDERFVSGLFESESPDLRRYLLVRIEESRGGELMSTTDLEHLAPQKPGVNIAYWHGSVSGETPDEYGLTYDNYVDSWGNITLLESRLNKSIRNLEWPSKISGVGRYQGLNASNYGVNAVIKTLPTWTARHIRNREQWMKDCAVALVSREWVLTGANNVGMWARPD